MIVKIDHIGIAVKSVDEAVKLYTDKFGLKVEAIEVVEEQKARTAVIPIGETKIELLETTDPEGPIGKYIAARGEGLHHFSLEVTDIQDTLEMLQEKGVLLIDAKPRDGVGGSKIAFLHPKTAKVLIELVEH